MRTTITLDDDVAAKLQSKARESGRAFKDVVNDALRKGLAVDVQAKRLAPFTIEAGHLIHLRAGLNYDKVEKVFDRLDSPSRKR